MPVNFYQFDNEPIVVAEGRGHVTVEEMVDVFRKTAAIAQTIDGPVYRITDTRYGDTSFIELFQMMIEASKKAPGSTIDPRIRPILLGTSAMVKLAAELVQKEQFANLSLPLFREMDDALTYIRNDLAKIKNA
ncbi:MAG: hypothetical protein D6737_01480 [Chloroflexi bacterium]|nr:MAG: hypothetical protein D6737_01480 [Chloroflexota bacterium]